MGKKYTIGVDFGTLSGRAVVVDTEDGRFLSECSRAYPKGILETFGKTVLPKEAAISDILDYEQVLFDTVREAVKMSGVSPDEIIGIAIDVTSSTFLPLDSDLRPLSFDPRFQDRYHAGLKLWKYHLAGPQAERITKLAEERDEPFLRRCGGIVNAEWMLPKLLETLENDPEVYDVAASFMEAADYLVYRLTGEETRSMCHAGYKLLWSKKDGYPDPDFLGALHPKFRDLRGKLRGREVFPGEIAGYLTKEAAGKTGLFPGTPVAASLIDAHVAVPSAGIDGPGQALIILGTSCCMLLLSEAERFVPGISGCVLDGVYPGIYAYEAGQSAVGDMFDWFVKNCVPAAYEEEAKARGISIHTLLSEKAALEKPGESGLIALDWWNGNRSCLADPALSGLILGLTLRTKPEEIYRALLESAAYGIRAIFDTFRECGVEVRSITASGGISTKNPLMMQIYADVLNTPVDTAASGQGSAFGAAVYAAKAAGKEAGGYDDIREAARRMGHKGGAVYFPDSENSARYQKLYSEYRKLLSYFGQGGNEVMHFLHEIRE